MSPAPDRWLGGRLILHQPGRGAHRAGTDAVLLAALVGARDGYVVVDAGAGTGAVGLAAALAAPGCRVLLIERDPDLAAMARANAAANGLSARVETLQADILASGAVRRQAGLAAGIADIVLTNPPYFEPGRHRPSPNVAKAQAHDFAQGGLQDGLDAWLRTCVDLLKPGGRLGLIHRADALECCLDALRGRFGGVRLRPVHPAAGRPAIRILVTAVKGSRAPLALEAPLILHGPDGHFTSEAEALHRGEAPPD